MGPRRLAMVTATTVALLVMPAGLAAAEEVALGEAQQTEAHEPAATGETETSTEPEPEPETGIGEPHSIECEGAVTVTVVDLGGAPVPGGILMVAGQQLVDAGTVDTGCGETTASLLGIPEGYAVVGEASTAVVVRNATATPVVFRVDPVAVLDAEVEAPAAAPTPAPSPSPTPVAFAPDQAADEPAAPELARTGIADPEVLGVFALLFLAAGIAILRRTPPLPR